MPILIFQFVVGTFFTWLWSLNGKKNITSNLDWNKYNIRPLICRNKAPTSIAVSPEKHFCRNTVVNFFFDPVSSLVSYSKLFAEVLLALLIGISCFAHTSTSILASIWQVTTNHIHLGVPLQYNVSLLLCWFTHRLH